MFGRNRRSRLVLAVPVIAGALLLSACSTDSTTSEPAASGAAEAADIGTETPGVLKLAADFSASPNQFLDDAGKEDGLNVALCTQMADELGVTIEWTNLGFDALIPGLQAGQYDALCTSVFVTAAREEVMNMVPYVQWGNTIGVQAADADDYECDEADAPCWDLFSGKTVAAPAGGSEVKQLEAANADLSEPMTIQTFDSNVQVYQALQNGSVDAAFVNDPQFAFYNKNNNDEFSAVFTGVGSTPLALTTLKDNVTLAEAFETGLAAMEDDGTYDTILEEWGITGVDDFSMIPAPAS